MTLVEDVTELAEFFPGGGKAAYSRIWCVHVWAASLLEVHVGKMRAL
jgi:hypothetical protein